MSTPRRPRPSIWPKIPAGFVRAVLAGHSSLGLAFAALIYLVVFSGTVAVFVQEFERWERPQAAVLDSVPPQALQRLAEDVAEAAEGEVEHVYLYPPHPDLPRLTAYVDTAGGVREFIGAADGAIAGPGDVPWSNFMAGLHIYLHLPQAWGMFIVGLTGVALLSSLISGVLAHPRIFRDAFQFRWGGPKRLQEADLHTRLGVWGLPFHVLVSLTGALLGMTTFIVGVLALVVFQGDVNKAYDLFLTPHPPEDARPAPFPDLAAAMETLAVEAPDATPRIIVVEHPYEQGQFISVTAQLPNTLSRGDVFLFDGQGALTHADRLAESTAGEKIFATLGPLHFGWFGGLPIRIAYGLLGLGLTVVTASSVSIWLARRRDKGRPAQRWERIWIATIWSQAAAYPASALALVAAPAWATEERLAAVWLAVTALAFLPAFALSAARLSAVLRGIAAALLLLVAVVHPLRHGLDFADGMGWGVDATLFMIAVLLALSLRPVRQWIVVPGVTKRSAGVGQR